MILIRDVEAEDVSFRCSGTPVSGLYRIDEELVTLMHLPDLNREGTCAFYVFRGQRDTVATEHAAGTELEIVQIGLILDC